MTIYTPKILITCMILSRALGWGPRFEPTKGRLSRSSLLISNDDHHEQEETLTIGSHGFKLHGLFDQAHEETSGILDLVRGRADALAAETFADVSSNDSCRGEECEMECAIPADWGTMPGPVKASEVMDFLGIQRAKPLRTPKDWD